MMLPIPPFNPGDTVKYPNGNGVIQVGAADAGSKMLLYNESPFNLNIDFLNGSQSILHAWEARYWTLDGDTRQVEWDLNSSLNVVNSPISLVIGELYNAGEKLEGTYPMGLIRQANVGNTGGIATTTTNQVINDGNTLQQVIEATLSGHTSSDVIINNDGSYTLKGTGSLAAAAVLTHILGTLTVDDVLSPKTTPRNSGVQVTSIDWGNSATISVNGSLNGPDLIFASNSAFQMFASGQRLMNVFFGEIDLVQAGGLVHILGALTVDQAATFAAAILPNIASSASVNGQTSGTATLYMPLQGSALKVALVVLNNYKNTANQTLALPTAFTANGSWFFITGLNGAAALLSSGVAQTLRVFTVLAAGGGTTSGQATVSSNSFGFMNAAWDTVQLQLNTAPATGMCIFVGS